MLSSLNTFGKIFDYSSLTLLISDSLTGKSSFSLRGDLQF